MIASCIAGVVVCFYLFKKYQELQWGSCKSIKKLDGKVAIITGASSGIGKETAKEFAKRGAIVILGCRNKLAAQEAVRDIRATTTNGDLIVIELDLTKLESVKKCAENILRKFSHIDILVNNAGVFYPPDMEMQTSDGYEIHFGVNHLGHFLLTYLLLERIKQTQNSRIVIVASTYYKSGKIDFGTIAKCNRNISNRKGRNPLYADSKLCNILHALQLSYKLKGTTTGIYVLCPGFVYTSLFRYMEKRMSLLKKLAFLPLALFTMRTANQGAQTTVYCSVSEDLDGVPFGFYRNCAPCELAITNDDTADRLWEMSMDIVSPYLL